MQYFGPEICISYILILVYNIRLVQFLSLELCMLYWPGHTFITDTYQLLQSQSHYADATHKIRNYVRYISLNSHHIENIQNKSCSRF
jgi:hypothetical protein